MKPFTWFLLLLLIPFASFAQYHKPLFTLALSADFPKNTHVLGGHLTANGKISPDLYLGAGLGISEFENDNNLYVPVYANFMFLPSTQRSNIKFLLNLAPGYGIYNRSYRDRLGIYKVTGGFYFFGGVGIMGTAATAKPFMAVGYARYGFNNNGYSYGSDAVAIRVGVGF